MQEKQKKSLNLHKYKVETLKNIKEVKSTLKNAVNIVNEINASEDEYLFVLNFNEKVIPVNYKDEDYYQLIIFTDAETNDEDINALISQLPKFNKYQLGRIL